MIDIYHSRRGHFRYCQYWNRDESKEINDYTKWILSTFPNGSFYAKEVTSKTNQGNQINNIVMFDKNTITLVTDDKVSDIKRGSVVSYLNHAWLVENVQFETHLKESEFSTEEYTTYITIARAN